ncbi:hypothetical protein ACFLRC_02045 [Candidatus Altiarchaeota archaeon]
MMKKGLRLAIALILLIFSSSFASAWDSTTQEWFAREVCERFDCGCEKHIVSGALKPIEVFKDLYTHYCYNLTDACFREGWRCPEVRNCPALEKMDAWMGEARESHGCSAWHDIGTAGNYFLDSREFFRQVSGASLKECVEPFENSVSQVIGQEKWTVCKCGVCLDANEFYPLVEEFSNQIGFMVRLGEYDTRRIVVLANSLDNGLAQDLYPFLRGAGFEVLKVDADQFENYKNEKFILILGGHRSPEGVGDIVNGVLKDKEKTSLILSATSTKSFEKANVFHPSQVVFVFAGHEKEQTQQAWMAGKDRVVELLRGSVEELECVRDSDCGEPFYGNYSCQNFYLTQALNKPKCANYECKIQLELEKVERCTAGKYCVPGMSRCQWLTENEGIGVV